VQEAVISASPQPVGALLWLVGLVTVTHAAVDPGRNLLDRLFFSVAERIEVIFARLRASRTYADDLENQSIDRHRPRAATMERLLDALETDHGGAPGWLRAHGWTEQDAAGLRKHLLD